MSCGSDEGSDGGTACNVSSPESTGLSLLQHGQLSRSTFQNAGERHGEGKKQKKKEVFEMVSFHVPLGFECDSPSGKIVYSSNVHQETTVFLPMTFLGAKVLTHVDGGQWLVDKPEAPALAGSSTWSVRLRGHKGLSYRSSPHWGMRSKKLATFARWGSLVKGNDTGDGWLQTQVISKGPEQCVKDCLGLELKCLFAAYRENTCYTYEACNKLTKRNGSVAVWMKAAKGSCGQANCEMLEKTLDTKRCGGEPWSGRGGLGKLTTRQECQAKCVATPFCNFAVWTRGMCSAFMDCQQDDNSDNNASGWTVWERQVAWTSVLSWTAWVYKVDQVDCRLRRPPGQMPICLYQNPVSKITFGGAHHHDGKRRHLATRQRGSGTYVDPNG